MEIATIVGDTMEQLNAVNDTLATSYLEKLQPFTAYVFAIKLSHSCILTPKYDRYLEQTKAEIDQHRQFSYPARLAVHADMADLLARRENELRHRAVVFCVSSPGTILP